MNKIRKKRFFIFVLILLCIFFVFGCKKKNISNKNELDRV